MNDRETEATIAICAAAERLAKSPTKSTAHMAMSERTDGIRQMLLDLYKLADRDGCIAAAWAYEVLTSQVPT